MRHTKKKLITLSIYTLFMTAMYGGYVGSLTWFDNRSTLPDNFEGESGKAFFGGGDGSSSSPYQIKTARHFYNLCWLQYLGRFNKDTDDDGVINQIYFTLENDIDCSTLGSALPPIGTTRYPFVGNFNGNDHVIKNYTITDKYSELTKHPSIIDTENTYYTPGNTTINYCSIIGTFGVIGYNTTGATDVATDETSLYVFNKAQLEVNSVNNLYIDNVTIKPATKNTLAGLLAGYVSANMSRCGVHYSNLNFSNGNTNISSDKFGGKLSNYSLIGDYNSTDYDWDGHSGQNNDFGGSLDLLTLTRRATYIFNSGNASSYGLTAKSSSTSFNWLTSTSYLNIQGESILPLNVNLSTTKLDEVSGNTDTSNNFYKNNTSEPILDTNSGYITGGDGITRIRCQATKKDSQGIKDSVKKTSDNNFDLFTDSTLKIIDKEKLKSNIAVYTYNFKTNKINVIQDEDNKTFVQTLGTETIESSTFKRYEYVKKGYDDMLYNSTTAYYNNGGTDKGLLLLSGVKFRQDTTTSINQTFEKNVKWLGKTKNIKFHKNGIQFEITQNGYFTCIISKFEGSGNYTAFGNLYSLNESSEPAEITSIKDSSGNLVFDFSKISTNSATLGNSYLYYFEFPISKGTYFLTSTVNSNMLPYYLYLDIGANAGDSGKDEKEGKIEDIDFYYYDNDTKQLVKVSSDNASNVVFDISGDGSAVFYFNRILNIGVLYFDENANGLTRTQPSTFTGTSVQATDKSCTTASS